MTMQEAINTAAELRTAFAEADRAGRTEEAKTYARKYEDFLGEAYGNEGEAFCEILRYSAESMARGNLYMNIHENFESIDRLKEYGIKNLTFTSNSTAATKALIKLMNAGYNITGNQKVCVWSSRWDTIYEDAIVLELA